MSTWNSNQHSKTIFFKLKGEWDLSYTGKLLYVYNFNLNYLKYHFDHLFGFTPQPPVWMVADNEAYMYYMYEVLEEHETTVSGGQAGFPKRGN